MDMNTMDICELKGVGPQVQTREDKPRVQVHTSMDPSQTLYNTKTTTWTFTSSSFDSRSLHIISNALMKKSWAKLNLKSKLNHHLQNLIQFEFNLQLQQINCRIHTEIEISNQWRWHAESRRNYGRIMVLFKKFALIKEAISKRNNLRNQNSDAMALWWIAGTKILLFPSDFTSSSSHNLLLLCNFLLPRESWRENELRLNLRNEKWKWMCQS